ncbi:MAG: hypothetical protein ACI4NE_05780 [Succinivibrio sp.]
MSQLEFRFLSGENIGSVIRLPVGSYTLGNTDRCDILSEESLKEELAVELEITEQLEVLVTPVSGNILIDRKNVSATEKMAPGSILLLGMTAVTYRLDGSDWPLITAKDLLTDPVEETSQEITDGGESSDKNETQVTDNETVADEQEEESSAVVASEKKKTGPIKITGIIVSFLAALTFLGMLIFGQSVATTTEDSELENITKTLADNGFSLVKAEYKNEMYVISGLVEDDEALVKLEQILPDSSHSMLVLVDRISFIAQSVRKAYTLYGIHVNPVFEDGTFRLYGYISDPYLSNKVTESVAANLPKSVKLEPHFTYKDEMKKILEASGSGDYQVKYYFKDGEIVYEGRFTREQSASFSKTKKMSSEKVGGEVCFIDISTLSEGEIELLSMVKNSKNNADGDETESISKDPKDDITGVTMDPMKFITMKNGDKIFEGGVLPDGSTLLKISSESLLLEKGGVKEEYELK